MHGQADSHDILAKLELICGPRERPVRNEYGIVGVYTYPLLLPRIGSGYDQNLILCDFFEFRTQLVAGIGKYANG